MLEIGSVVDGKYKILNVIGHGGMSIVYLAMNEKANKQWAVKEVRKDGVKDFEVIKQGLIVETDLLKKLRHPNLPSIVDVIDSDDTFLIVMDYVEGRSLGDALDKNGAQSQDKVIDWAKQLCDVLIYLHSREPAIIYRDLKPNNIMLCPDGKIMLIDFGTAREFKESSASDTVCLGTIGYAAPEQFGGMGQTDERTDIYGLGASMYHLLTGQSPCKPPYEMRPIREIDPNLSSGLEKIVLKCVEKNPDLRYQSCEELLYELQNYNKLDDIYIKSQKRKLGVFLCVMLLSLICLTGGFIFHFEAETQNNLKYDNLLDKALKAHSSNTQIEIYEQAINVKPDDTEAYLGMIEAMKADGDFTIEEEQKIVGVLDANTEKIKENRASYSEICFNVGKLYWYYYNYGKENSSDEDTNKTTRVKSAYTWFVLAAENAASEFKQYNMAVIYRDIGKFYWDINKLTTEAGDSGNYIALYNNYNKLLDMIDENKEAEIVKLELYNEIISGIGKYAEKFSIDGVKFEDLNALTEKTDQMLSRVNATTEKTIKMKEDISDNVPTAKERIRAVYN